MDTQTVLTRVAHLSDRELLTQVEALARCEREATAALVVHLAEHAAYNRIQAARAVRRFPIPLAHLAAGALHLAAIRLLAPHLTPENLDAVLAQACGKSKRGVEELVARLAPQPPVPDHIRKLPVRSPVSSRSGQAPRQADASSQDSVMTMLAKLREAQALLRHQIPDGALAQIFDRALDALLAQLHTQKHAATARPRPGRAWPEPRRSSSRHIPAAVRRAVWARDGGRCAFVADDGRRCAALDFLEFHHVVPYARGGPAIADNLELRCRAHNGYEATRQMARWHTDEVREAPAGYSPDVLGRERDAGAAAGARLLNSPRGEFDVHGHTIGQLARGQSVR